MRKEPDPQDEKLNWKQRRQPKLRKIYTKPLLTMYGVARAVTRGGSATGKDGGGGGGAPTTKM